MKSYADLQWGNDCKDLTSALNAHCSDVKFMGTRVRREEDELQIEA
ncbi:MAG: hypothetical protein LBU32_22295 [Clostridiales bacterium]|jgi:hypothetical protein|nr:hypothetical protein [Clostridiales bacterium]